MPAMTRFLRYRHHLAPQISPRSSHCILSCPPTICQVYRVLYVNHARVRTIVTNQLSRRVASRRTPVVIMRTVISSDGLAITLGQSAAENQHLCKHAKQNDLWFHLDNHPSPHAILTVAASTSRKRSPDISASVHECMQLVKYFSKLRDVPQATVIYIPAKFVSKHGAEDKLGAVTLTKSPDKRSVVADQPTLTDLLSRIQNL